MMAIQIIKLITVGKLPQENFNIFQTNFTSSTILKFNMYQKQLSFRLISKKNKKKVSFKLIPEVTCLGIFM